MNKNEKSTPSTIGQRIRELRTKKDITQDVLSGFICVHKTTISRWENDKALPTPDMINALAEKFEVSPYFLAYGLTYDPADNSLDLNGLTFRQIGLVKKLVEELRKGC